ncbi:MAG: PhoPQ-activated protein PqaA family protein [Planctomycetota bacterium]
MPHPLPRGLAAALAMALLAAASAPAQETLAPPAPTTATALDDYVAAAGTEFAWRVLTERAYDDRTELVLEMTSQRWRADEEVSRGVWRHWVSLVVPKRATAETALLFITGGANDKDPPRGGSGLIRTVALSTNTVCAVLNCVPNQPTVVYDSDEPDRPRYEDDLLAATWNRFADTGDPTWLAQLAMAKSAVRAMDAVQEAVADVDGAPAIERFTVAGASKRGWTTWLAAIVDDRVAGIAPIVIDLLNIGPSMRHHLACYGEWSRALKDYDKQGVADKLGKPAGDAILSIVDPYRYRERLTLPKVMVNASGDEFFLPDSSRFYYDDLVGEKHLSYTPNTGHGLGDTNALETVVAFHASVAQGLERPSVRWTGPDDAGEHVAAEYVAAEYAVRCSAEPVEAVLWRAVNAKARDFRHPVVGDAFQSTPLEPDADGAYRVDVTAPPSGFAAVFARFTFDIGAAVPWRVSTPVWIAPDIEPFGD